MGQAIIAGKAIPLYSTTFNQDIPAASWTGTPPSYTLTNANITATNIVEMYHQASATVDQIKMIQNANIVHGTQVAGSIVLKCIGDKPTESIPVQFVIRSDT